MRGHFITTEGIDGCGKSTQFRLIGDYLKNRGYDVIIAREPGGTQIGEKIRKVILDPENKEMDPSAELLLYAAARAQLISQVIAPAIDAGKIVLCDRFVDSSYVYQGFARGLGLDAVKEVNRIAIKGYMPDMTFMFDLDIETAKKRCTEREFDRIEQEKASFHYEVYKGYRKISELFPERIAVIDANGSIDEVFSKVKERLDILIETKAI